MIECLFANEVVLVWNPAVVTETSDIAPVSSKEFLDVQKIIECTFTLKRKRDILTTKSQS